MRKIVLLTLVASLALVVPAAEAQKAPLCPTTVDGRVADVFYDAGRIYFQPLVEHERVQLTVTTPCSIFTKIFEKGDTPIFDLADTEGTIDGRYTWELRVVPYVDPDVRETLKQARLQGDFKTPLALQQKGLLPSGPLAESQAFLVVNGTIVEPREEEEPRGKAGTIASKAGGLQSYSADGGDYYGAGTRGEGTVAAKDFVINDDLIVDGSACIGFDCVNGEVFSFDTIRLKENNLRIKFDDTSVVPSFPANDWQLTANDSANGGASKFSIDDITNNRTPFTVEANARSHSLYVDDGGRIGSRTSTPSVEIHTIDGDTPTLRLQQDGSSGFEPQTWDVAGNETNFFIRDVTNGSTLPFRIRPTAPSNSIFIDIDGDVGFGTSAPDEELHVIGTNNPRLLIEDTSDDANDKPGVVLRSPAAATAGDWAFEVDNAGNFQIDFGPSTGPELIISDSTATNGTVTVNGNLVVNGTCTGCDAVFQPDFELESIEEHAAFMWTQSHLPAVGPTPEGKTAIDVFEKTTGILQELEKAHIYIEQLHRRLARLEQALMDQEDERE